MTKEELMKRIQELYDEIIDFESLSDEIKTKSKRIQKLIEEIPDESEEITD